MSRPYVSRIALAGHSTGLRPRVRSRFEPAPVLPIDGPAIASPPALGDGIGTGSVRLEIDDEREAAQSASAATDQVPVSGRQTPAAPTTPAATPAGALTVPRSDAEQPRSRRRLAGPPATRVGRAGATGETASAESGAAAGPDDAQPAGAADISLDLPGATVSSSPSSSPLRVPAQPSTSRLSRDGEPPGGEQPGSAPADSASARAGVARASASVAAGPGRGRDAPGSERRRQASAETPADSPSRMVHAGTPDTMASIPAGATSLPAPSVAPPPVRSAPPRQPPPPAQPAVPTYAARLAAPIDAPRRSRSANREAPEPPPQLTVTIGRIDVTASTAAAAPAKPTPPTPRRQPPSLQDYLRARARGSAG